MQITPAPLAPRGTHWDGAATTISLSSRSAEAIELCVFDEDGTEERVELAAHGSGRFTGRSEELRPGTRYGLRAHGPWAPHEGHRHNPNKLLLDPHGLQMEGRATPGPVLLGHDAADPLLPSPLDSAAVGLRSVVVDPAFDWQDTGPLGIPIADTILYETHVRGATMRHPGIPASLRGTYAGFAHEAMLQHLTELGVTAVELLPIHGFVHEQHLLAEGRRNHWGYNSIAFFAPHRDYASGPDPVDEFKTMVRELHRAGIEVILDVVYNHTAEGNESGPTLCFRGLDNQTWYRLDPADRAHYLNWTGTGNTVDASSPDVVALVMDSLRYWVSEMHVDGFRFDLATTLGRTRGDFDPLAGLLVAAMQDPVLANTKLIAEPWDVGPGGYQVGGFPRGWSEWNDQYRDTVRDFWRGRDGALPRFATRITGSSDIFEHTGRRPTACVNFVTSHDGFTLTDLVTYERKRNHANGENNRDGNNDNRAWNSGVEGPTGRPGVKALRERRKRSFLATLLLSQGIPMLLGGDELGRTQRGNNNTYNQDNELTWYDWEQADDQLAAFVARLIELRRSHPTFRRTEWLHEHAGALEDHVAWYAPSGEEMTSDDWTTPHARSVGLFLRGTMVQASAGPTTDDDFLLLFNSSEAPIEFVLPPSLGAESWVAEVDTASDGAVPSPSGSTTVAPYGLLVLRRPTKAPRPEDTATAG